MKYVVERTCTLVTEDQKVSRAEKPGTPLKSFAEALAYVLIGEPGAGKTTAFEKEAKEQGGVFVEVRNFLTFKDKPEWHGKTLFLDGLDESRIGVTDGRTPLDQVRGKPGYCMSSAKSSNFGSGAPNRDSRVCMRSMIGCSGTIGRILDAPPPTPVVCQRAGAALGGG